MSPAERAEELLAEVLDGELDSARRDELDALLASDSALATTATAQYRLHRLLPLAARGPDGDRFDRAVMHALRPATGRFAPGVSAAVRRRPARTWAWIAAAAAIAIAVGAAAWSMRAAPTADVVLARLVAGDSGVLVDGAPSAAAGSDLRLGAVIDASDGAPCTIAYGDGTRLTVAPGASVQLTAWPSPTLLAGRKQLRLLRGSLEAEVTPQPSSASLQVATRHAVAEVVGTRFGLALEGERTRLAVTHGSVRLTRTSDGAAVLVAAGERSTVADAIALAVEPIPAALVAHDFESDVLHPGWVLGRREPDPQPRPGSRACVAGVTSDGQLWSRVRLEAPAGDALVAHRDALELTFEYLVDASVKSIDVYLWNDTQQRTFGDLHLTGLTHGTWTRATVRLDELRSVDDPALRMRDGDRIQHLVLQTGQVDGVLRVDHVTIAPP